MPFSTFGVCDRPLKEMLIIAFTALTMPDDRQRCLDVGADDYLSKPVKIKELHAMSQFWPQQKDG